MADSEATSVAKPAVKAAILAFFEKYSTFDVSAAQIALEVTAPLPELLLALDELLAAGQVVEGSPGAYQHAKGREAALERQRDVRQEAFVFARTRMAYLERRGLDHIWSFARLAESVLPVASLSEVDRERAHRAWEIGHMVLGWALRLEAGGSSEPFETRGGRSVTADGHRKKPRFPTPVTVGAFVDDFIVINDNYFCRSATTRIAGFWVVPTGRVRLSSQEARWSPTLRWAC